MSFPSQEIQYPKPPMNYDQKVYTTKPSVRPEVDFSFSLSPTESNHWGGQMNQTPAQPSRYNPPMPPSSMVRTPLNSDEDNRTANLMFEKYIVDQSDQPTNKFVSMTSNSLSQQFVPLPYKNAMDVTNPQRGKGHYRQNVHNQSVVATQTPDRIPPPLINYHTVTRPKPQIQAPFPMFPHIPPPMVVNWSGQYPFSVLPNYFAQPPPPMHGARQYIQFIPYSLICESNGLLIPLLHYPLMGELLPPLIPASIQPMENIIVQNEEESSPQKLQFVEGSSQSSAGPIKKRRPKVQRKPYYRDSDSTKLIYHDATKPITCKLLQPGDQFETCNEVFEDAFALMVHVGKNGPHKITNEKQGKMYHDCSWEGCGGELQSSRGLLRHIQEVHAGIERYYKSGEDQNDHGEVNAHGHTAEGVSV